MKLYVMPDGSIKTLYGETLDLAAVGRVSTPRRASHVEPSPEGWLADMGPSEGPVLGPFSKRSEALAAEEAWLERSYAGGA